MSVSFVVQVGASEAAVGGVGAWVAFVSPIAGLLLLDLGVFHRRPRAQTVREAAAWSVFWITLAGLFAVLVYVVYEHAGAGPGVVHGRTAALEFLTAYLLEKTLSVDNLFVIALVFSHFRIPLAQQHRVLFWGVFGALVMRGLMIGLGAEVLHRFSWATLLFGGLVLITAVRLLVVRPGRELDPRQGILVRCVRRLAPVSDTLHGSRFVLRVDGRLVVTPLLITLLVIEAADLLFAIDSVPAVFAITEDAFLVYTSNAFAVLGLRSLYFVLTPLLDRFRFARQTLVLILAFVGLKMLATGYVEIPIEVSLGVVALLLLTGVLASTAAPTTRAQRPL